MNYHILICIKGIIGIITFVLVLFFVNPYQDHILAIGGFFIALIFLTWSLGYFFSLLLHRIHIFHTHKDLGLVSYIYGFGSTITIVLCILITILYHHRLLTSLITLGSFILMSMMVIVLSHKQAI